MVSLCRGKKPQAGFAATLLSQLNSSVISIFFLLCVFLLPAVQHTSKPVCGYTPW